MHDEHPLLHPVVLTPLELAVARPFWHNLAAMLLGVLMVAVAIS